MRTVDRYMSVPVAGCLDADAIDRLDGAGFDIDAFHSIPLAGALTVEQLIRLAPTVRQVAQRVHEQDRHGPITPDELMALVP